MGPTFPGVRTPNGGLPWRAPGPRSPSRGLEGGGVSDPFAALYRRYRHSVSSIIAKRIDDSERVEAVCDAFFLKICLSLLTETSHALSEDDLIQLVDEHLSVND